MKHTGRIKQAYEIKNDFFSTQLWLYVFNSNGSTVFHVIWLKSCIMFM